MLPEDRRLLESFAARVRALLPTASITAFGSRARGSPHAESDLDLCVVVPELTREVREAIYTIAWDVGFGAGVVLTPILMSEEDFDRGPLSASTLVAMIRREGVAA